MQFQFCIWLPENEVRYMFDVCWELLRCGVCDYDFEVLRALRGRPTLRSLTASRSFGSISHSRPNLNAFKRFALIIARTLFVVTPNRLAASAEVMIFMGQSIAFCEIMACRHKFS